MVSLLTYKVMYNSFPYPWILKETGPLQEGLFEKHSSKGSSSHSLGLIEMPYAIKEE